MRTIGCLTFDLAGPYNFPLWKDLSESAIKNGVQLITFCGGLLNDPSDLHRHWNRIFDLASDQVIDGLIVLSSSISHSCGVAGLAEFLNRYKNIPVVSIGVEIEGFTSILVDNEGSMKTLVQHMLNVHKVKKPLFLSGPSNNQEAKVRLELFKMSMNEHGHTIDPALIKNADFRYDIAMDVMREFLSNKVAFDSIIAANDDMALGALEILLKAGIKVPQKIPICGFDDSDSAPCSAVPLTTMRQPISAIAEKAIDIVINLLDGIKMELVHRYPSEIVVRKSCGCLAKEYISLYDQQVIDVQKLTTFPNENIFNINSIKTTLSGICDSIICSDQKDELWAKFKAGVETGEFDETLLAFSNIVQQSIGNKTENLTAWHNILTLWQALSRNTFGQDVSRWPVIEDFFLRARFLIIDAGNIMQASQRMNIKRRDLRFFLFSASSSLIVDFYHSLESIANELPKFGIVGTYVCRFDEENYLKNRLIMNYTPDGSRYWNREGIIFDSKNLLPDSIVIDEKYNIVIEPLLNYEDIIGYIIYQFEEPIEIMENIHQQVKNTLISNQLIHEVLKDKQLKVLLHDLEQKQHELEKAYSSLEENQEKMLIIEKMASLGRMTAGIAHEMSTPIAAIRIALSGIKRLIAEYDASIRDPEITQIDHLGIVNDMRHTIDLAESAADKAAAFVHGMRSQTRDLEPKDRFRFNAVSVIRESLLLLGHTLKYGNCEMVFTPQTEYVELFGVPGRLSQIITNLVNNAVDACTSAGRKEIIIKLKKKNNEVELSVSDNGCGISHENITKIFDPMFTTKPFGVGTGLGLTLVHNIVTGDFGGKIDVDSTPGNGTTFTITFTESKEAVRGKEV
ncbi:MAG: substrate-binding domain-containing protein [Deltaproteobacteria bacterium]|nr:substrate-binding domain-containing protein [Deltaproteobacteria bacterium]